jgi:hypothetical protein
MRRGDGHVGRADHPPAAGAFDVPDATDWRGSAPVASMARASHP